MHRLGKDTIDAILLCHATGIENRHAITDLRYDRHVMCDKQQSEVAFAPAVARTIAVARAAVLMLVMNMTGSFLESLKSLAAFLPYHEV